MINDQATLYMWRLLQLPVTIVVRDPYRYYLWQQQKRWLQILGHRGVVRARIVKGFHPLLPAGWFWCSISNLEAVSESDLYPKASAA